MIAPSGAITCAETQASLSAASAIEPASIAIHRIGRIRSYSFTFNT